MKRQQKEFKRRVAFSVLILVSVCMMLFLVSITGVFAQADSVEPTEVKTTEEAGIAKFGLIAAAVAFGFGAIGAGMAISTVGAAAMGAIGEKPEIASQALIFIALAEGLVVFGFITALMILGKF